MKKSTRFLSLLLSIVMILGVLPINTYAFDKNNDVMVSESEYAEGENSVTEAFPHNSEIVTESFSVDARYWLYENTDYVAPKTKSGLLTASEKTYDNVSGYGGQLTANQKKIYDALVSKYVASNGLCGTSTGALTYSPASGSMYKSTVGKDVSYAYFAFSYDYPQVFWSGGYSSSYSYWPDTQEVTTIEITLTEKYANAKADISAFNSGVISAAGVIKSSISDTSVYGYYKAIHDWMCQNMSYNNAALTNPGAHPRAHSCAGVFVGNGAVVCQGYGESFKVLCDYIRKAYSVDLYTAMIIGSAELKKDHMWNYAYMPNGNWYAVDVCWDDQDSGMRDTYFLCGRNSQGFNDTFINERKEENSFDSAGTITFTYPVIADDKYGSNENEKGTFSFRAVSDTCDATASYYYSDTFFEGSSKPYNHDLSKMSIRLALSAFNSVEGDYSENTTVNSIPDIPVKAQNVADLLSKCGFSQMKTIGYSQKPTQDSIAACYASKQIGDNTVIAVAIRGGGYEAEWAGNFNVYSNIEPDYHAGFLIAACEVFTGLLEYMIDNEIYGSSNLKFWVVGYSRAGATANLVSAMLFDKGIANDENIYSYTFEAPQAKQSNVSLGHDYIHNIVNPIDPVPKVVMENWDFKRYGTDYWIPSRNSSYNEFANCYDEVLACLNSYYSNEGGVTYSILPEIEIYWEGSTYSQEVALDEVMTFLAQFFESQNSDKFIQYSYIISSSLLSGYYEDAESVSILTVIYKAFFDLFLKGPLGLKEFVPIIRAMVTYFTNEESANTASLLLNAHHPEFTMAWLDVLNDKQLKTDGSYRLIKVNCPVDLSVFDSNGTMVAQIIEDEIQDIAGSYINAYIDFDGQKVIILPGDEDFQIDIEASDNGNMTYSVSQYDYSRGAISEVVNFYDVPISNGDKFCGIVEECITTTNPEYSLSNNQTNEVILPEILVGDAVEYYNIEVTADGNGTVDGNNYKYKGEFVKITALPDENETFLGWYCNDKLISLETSYRFGVEKDISLVGRFTSNGSTVIITDAAIPDTAYTISGQTITVIYDKACKVGYWDETSEKYISIPASANVDGSYSFTVPDGVAEVVLVVKGDLSGDGNLRSVDANYALKAANGNYNLTPLQLFAIDLNNDGRIRSNEANAILKAANGTALDW